jgi:hypothetical protein
MGNNDSDTFCIYRSMQTGGEAIAGDDDLWQCQNPGCLDVVKRLPNIRYPNIPPVRKCPVAPEIITAATQAAGKLGLLDAAGNLASEAIHYAEALARWVWAGFPVRSAEETAIRYAICAGERGFPKCDQFVDGKCSICGCPVKKKRGMLIKNKAALATEICPHPDGSKWP